MPASCRSYSARGSSARSGWSKCPSARSRGVHRRGPVVEAPNFQLQYPKRPMDVTGGHDDAARRHVTADRGTAGRSAAEGSMAGQPQPGETAYVIGVDTGGTFTDVTLLKPNGELVTGKAATTPGDFSV